MSSALSIQCMKLKLGSQRCRKQLFSDEWSSTFSFLVHDCNTEKVNYLQIIIPKASYNNIIY